MKRSGDPSVDLRGRVVRSASPRKLDVSRDDCAVRGVAALAGTLVVRRGTHRLCGADVVAEIQQQVTRMRCDSGAEIRVAANLRESFAGAIKIDPLEPRCRR